MAFLHSSDYDFNLTQVVLKGEIIVSSRWKTHEFINGIKNNMKYNPQKHHRRSIRLPEHDYSQPGGYFVTIVTQDRECLFGDVVNRKMVLNNAGKMIQRIWNELPTRFSNIQLDEHIVMPNHFHGIVIIMKKSDKSLGDMIGAFKSITTHEYILGVRNNGWQQFNKKLWQRNYWEHIIRDEKDLNRIREYIINNPLNWEGDGGNLDVP